MKKILITLLTLIMVFCFATCGNKVTLSGEIAEDMKSMEITANKSDKDDFMQAGALEVGENEQIVYDHQLEKGELEIQFIPEAEEQSIDELPDLDADPAKTLNLSETGGGSTYFGPGSYSVKVTSVGDEKAVGTVTLKVETIGE